VLRVVLDTSVWVSGLLWGGLPGAVLALIDEGKLTVYATAQMLNELARVLGYRKFHQRLQSLGLTPAQILDAVQNSVHLLEVPSSGEPLVPEDPSDDVFLRLAADAGADYLISGDEHLLSLKAHGGVPIVTVHQFLEAHFPDHLF